jgi:hypothetical protein
MRISRLTGFIVAAIVLAACSAPNNGGVIGNPAAAPNNRVDSQHFHALVAPGKAGKIAIMPGTPRQATHRMHHDFAATRPCTALSDNLSGDVRIYNKDLSLAGDFGTNAYGYGAYSNSIGTYYGRNDGSGSLDVYVNCTNHPGGTLVGANIGGAPYGIGGRRASSTVYAVLWPDNVIEWWPNGGSVVTGNDPFLGLAYFVDVDPVGNVWLTGFDYSFSNEELDECNSDFSSCSVKATIPGGFPGGVQVDTNETVYVNNQYGTLYSYDCSGSTCNQTGSFTYSNGYNPLDYTGIVLDAYHKHRLWGANIYYCYSAYYGICTDGQPQSLPLNSAVLGAPTPGWQNAEALGIARFPADRP